MPIGQRGAVQFKSSKKVNASQSGVVVPADSSAFQEVIDADRLARLKQTVLTPDDCYTATPYVKNVHARLPGTAGDPQAVVGTCRKLC